MTRLRGAGFVRTWRMVIRLRNQPHTIAALADAFEVTTRTIRRDLDVLQEAGLPLRCNGGRWSMGEIPEWPRREVAPVKALSAPA